MSPPRDRVVVIGAGSAGLSAAAALQRRGIPALVLDEGEGVGASWRRRHRELRLNTIRWLSDLGRPRIGRAAGRWVSRDDYVAHLEEFARVHRLDVALCTRADRIDRAGAGWRVRTGAGHLDAAHVVVATGHERVPVRPAWHGLGPASMPVVHAADLRTVAELAGRRVLLVGAGNSGVEIAGHLVDTGAAAVWVSVRTPPTILPLQVAGVPLNPLAVALRRLPERARDGVARRISRLAFGDLAPHGLPRPPRGPYERLRTTGVTVAVDRGFVGHLEAGRLEVVAPVTHLDGADVVLEGGRRLRPDVVVTATGYRSGLEPLVGHLGVLDRAGRPLSRPGRPTPGAPGLWFIGFRPAIEGNLRQHPAEARRIAREVAGYAGCVAAFVSLTHNPTRPRKCATNRSCSSGG